MKILITGGLGYLANYMVKELSKEYDIAIFDNITYEPHYLDDYEFYYGDITDYKRYREVINEFKPDVVINTGAIVGDAACQVDPILTKDTNQDSVKWLSENYNGKICQLSTCSGYGINNGLLDEETPSNPISLYAETKLKAEEYILARNSNDLIYRLGTLQGMTGGRPRLDLIVNLFSMLSALDQPLQVFNPEAWRPILHSKDVTTGIKLGLKENLSGIFVLSSENIQIGKLAEKVKKITGNPHPIQYKDKIEDLRNYRVSTEKIAKFGFSPRFDLTDGVMEVYNMVKQKRVKDPFSSLYHNGKFIKELYMAEP